MRFGEVLRQQREQHSVTLDGIAALTRVSLRHLQALEADQFQELPGGIFNRGIVRSYARCCGIDEEKTVEEFMQAIRGAGLEAESAPVELAAFAENVRRSRPPRHSERNLRWLGVAAMLFTVLVLALATAIVLHRRGMLALPHRREAAQESRTVVQAWQLLATLRR